MKNYDEILARIEQLQELPVSEEMLGAYMEGKLDRYEMEDVSKIISNNDLLNKIVNNVKIDVDSEIQLTDEIIEDDFLYKMQNTENILFTNNNIYNSNIMKENRLTNEQLGAMAAKSLFGEDAMGVQDAMIYQGDEGICAIRSQQIILRDYGIDISIDELKNFAIQNGWYDPSENGGTPMWAIGNLLESCNIDCRQQTDCTIYDIVNELAQGHRVIVGVDSYELWASREDDIVKITKEWFNDIFKGDTPNHALIVAGVEVNPNDPEDVKVILTDPGTGDLRIEYDLDTFMDAWKDSHCFMTTTTTPAPLQYDPIKGCEVPSNFAIEQFVETNSLPLNPNNVILPSEMAAMCADPYYKEGHLNSIPLEGKDIDFETYTTSVANSQQYKSVLANSHVLGQDHFDSKAFVDSLKNMLGIGADGDSMGYKNLETNGKSIKFDKPKDDEYNKYIQDNEDDNNDIEDDLSNE